MYFLNKFIGYLTNPVAVAWIGVLLALVVRCCDRKRLSVAVLVVCVAWVWLWATSFMSHIVGVPLERPYFVNGCVPIVGNCTNSEAIVLHGGSMGDDSGIGGRGEMWTSADRVWMAARLWKAGKAPVIYVTGGGVKKTTAGLLEDFGIPTNAVVFAEEPRNTEEEAKFIANVMNQVQRSNTVQSLEFKVKGREETPKLQTLNTKLERPKVLVVTSAWHMKRTMMMYAKYAPNVEAIPAPCDFENTIRVFGSFGISEFLPCDEALLANRVALHEWIGILGYKMKWFVVRN